MDIAYAAEDNYAVYAGVSIYSLCCNNRSAREINFYIISDGISEGNREKLRKIAESFGRSIFFKDVSGELKAFSEEIDAGSYGINVFGRFFMGRLLPENVERLLYIDCDTVVNGSLEPLFKEEFEEFEVAKAILEPTIYKAVLKSLGFSDNDRYFNSGVMLIDFKKWRREGVTERLVEFYKKNGERLYGADQDALNYVLKGRIGVLSPEYNFFTNYKYYSYGFLAGENASYREVSKEEFERAKREPKIIHYLGMERPWIRGNLNPYRRIYKSYSELTPFKGKGVIKGRELPVILFHVMELITLVSPMIRRRISRSFEKKNVIPRTESIR